MKAEVILEMENARVAGDIKCHCGCREFRIACSSCASSVSARPFLAGDSAEQARLRKQVLILETELRAQAEIIRGLSAERRAA